jgi:hypothetical protein
MEGSASFIHGNRVGCIETFVLIILHQPMAESKGRERPPTNYFPYQIFDVR